MVLTLNSWTGADVSRYLSSPGSGPRLLKSTNVAHPHNTVEMFFHDDSKKLELANDYRVEFVVNVPSGGQQELIFCTGPCT